MTRQEALSLLVRFDGPLDALRSNLAAFPFDWDGPPLATLSREHVLQVLARWNAGELSAEQIEGWANLLEGRDDLNHADGCVADAVFDLANPELQGPIDLVAPSVCKQLNA